MLRVVDPVKLNVEVTVVVLRRYSLQIEHRVHSSTVGPCELLEEVGWAISTVVSPVTHIDQQLIDGLGF